MEFCRMFNCWYNSDGYCMSVGDLRNDELGPDCPDYIDEDEIEVIVEWPKKNPFLTEEEKQKIKEYICESFGISEEFYEKMSKERRVEENDR